MVALFISCHRRRRHGGRGAFLPIEINPDKSEIIRALNSLIKVKICGEDLYF